MRVLMSGALGFTGHYVKEELEKNNHEVVALSSDLLDYEGVKSEVLDVKPDAFLHLAAVTFVAHANALDFYRVNLLGTYHLLEILHQYCPNIQSVMLVSSANVYGNGDETILSEEATPNPTNDYAVSKLAMEHMAKLWIDRLPLFIVRPFNYTGVGQRENFLIPKIVSHFKKRASTIELGNLDVWREFGDVRMVAEIYGKLLALAPVGKTLNVCTGEAHSLREVIAMASELTCHPLHIEVNKAFVREGEVRVLKGDNSQLKALVPTWTPKPFKETLAWMLA
ncbi:MAG: GDP-mannose 4,6-dehydratase [Tatlockia sp.]|jgi:nucleoside-diphosphate-sugar epimerase